VKNDGKSCEKTRAFSFDACRCFFARGEQFFHTIFPERTGGCFGVCFPFSHPFFCFSVFPLCLTPRFPFSHTIFPMAPVLSSSSWPLAWGRQRDLRAWEGGGGSLGWVWGGGSGWWGGVGVLGGGSGSMLTTCTNAERPGQHAAVLRNLAAPPATLTRF
jgi:hypothetical protein